jgi:hypothetical protein
VFCSPHKASSDLGARDAIDHIKPSQLEFTQILFDLQLRTHARPVLLFFGGQFNPHLAKLVSS